MVALAEAFVRVRPDVSGFRGEVEREVDRINLDAPGQRKGKEFGDGVDKGTRDLHDRGNRRGKEFSDGFGKGSDSGLSSFAAAFSRPLGAILSNLPAFTLFTGAATAATASVVRLGAAIAPAVNVVALVPAAGFAAAAGLGALKIATAGVGDAIKAGLTEDTKKFAKATHDMGQEALGVVNAIVALRPQLIGLRSEVSGAFFTGFRSDIQALAKAELPTMRGGLSGIASEFGQAGQRALEFGAQSQTVLVLRDALIQVRATLIPIAPSVQPILSIFRDLIAVGSIFLPSLTSGFAGAAQSAANFVSNARQTGQLREFIQSGLDVLGQLGGVLSSVGGIAKSVFEAMTAGGGNALGALSGLLSVLDAVLATNEAQRAMVEVFRALSTITQALGPAFGQILLAVIPLVPPLAQLASVVAVALAEGLVKLIPLITTIVTKLSEWVTKLAENKGLFDGFVSAIAGAATFLNEHHNILAGIVLVYGSYRLALIANEVAHVASTVATKAATLAEQAHSVAKAISTSTIGTWIGVKAIELGSWISSTAAAIGNTIATAANTVARGLNTAALFVATGGIQVFIATKAIELASWVRSTAATIASTVATVAHTVAVTAVNVATKIWAATQVVMNAVLAANPIGIVIVVLVALAAAIIYAYNHSETFRKIVQAAWAGIKDAASGAWNFLKTVFEGLANFVTVTIPNAFNRFVDATKAAWKAVQNAVKDPVGAVVNFVINPLLGGFSKIAGFFGIKGVPEKISGFEAGGRIPGAPSLHDNRIAAGPGGRNIAVATGEFIVNSTATSKFLPVLEAINRGRMPSGSASASAYRDSYATGGLIGGIVNFGKDVLDMLSDPAKALGNLVNAGINRIPGGGAFRDILVGMGRKLATGVIDKVKSLFSTAGPDGIAGNASPGFPPWPSSPGAQRGDSGVWRSVVALIRSTGPVTGAFGNAYRAGDPLWHGSGRAVDWMGFNQDALATFLAARRPLELIHRTPRRDYAYTRGVNKGSFNQSLMEEHRNHVHIAMRRGGLVVPARTSIADTGRLSLAPGTNVVQNNTGRIENMTTIDKSLLDRLDRLIEATEAVAPGVGKAITTASRAAVRAARAG